MRSLIWKEWRENFKWAFLPSILLLGPMPLFGVPMLMAPAYLAYVSLVAGLSGAILGFLQVAPEAGGDKRSLLLHRPLSPSRIFLGKILTGGSLYLSALLVPTACAVVLAATPGHVAAPFEWRMTLPWLADILTGLVYYFAGLLMAQREARWYASRCLPLAAGLFASLLVWNLPEFRHALLAIAVLSAIVAAAAWGSFLAAGAHPTQPRLAKIALAVTLFGGLSVLGFAAKVTLGLWLEEPLDYPYDIDRNGQLFMIHEAGQKILSVTDLEGRPLEEFKGQRLDWYAINAIKVRCANAEPLPRGQSYRNPSRCLLVYKNETTPPHEAWWYVPSQGRILGYDKGLKRFLGSFGPDGFVPTDEQPRDQFHEAVIQKSLGYEAHARDPLAFPTGVYSVDFHQGKVQTLFVPQEGERVRWAGKQSDKFEKWQMCFVGTDKAIYYLDQAGKELLATPLAYDPATEEVNIVGRLVNPDRYWAWYIPQWHLPLPVQANSPEAKVVVYDSAGRECRPRQESLPRPGVTRLTPVNYSEMLVEPSVYQAFSGLATSPVEAAVLAGTTSYLESQTRQDPSEVSLLLQDLWFTTQAFLPGVRWDLAAHPGLGFGFAASVLVASLAGAIACLLLPRRYAFPRSWRMGWALCGFLFGLSGLLLMLALVEWPAQIVCPKCRKPRVVTRPVCEHCGTPHAIPAADGTEIFEPTAADAHVASATN